MDNNGNNKITGSRKLKDSQNKGKRTKTDTIDKILQRKLNIQQHESHLKLWVDTCAPEELAVLPSLVTPDQFQF